MTAHGRGCRVLALLLTLAACAERPSDPRSAIAVTIPVARAVRLDVAKAVTAGRHFEACAGLKQRILAKGAEPDWQALLLVAARDPACLEAGQGEQLASFFRGRPGWLDAVGEWDAAHDAAVDLATLSAPSRLRVLLRNGDQRDVVTAAEAVLRADADDPFACAVVVEDAIERGELRAAVESCPGASSPALLHARAGALDEAGRFDEAVSAYDAAGYTLHAAAILYQEHRSRDAEALARMAEPVPPAAIHRGWLAILRGRAPDLAGLDGSPEATMIRALAGVPSAREALPSLGTLQARVLHARLVGDAAALESDLAGRPHSEVLLRAALGIRLDGGLDTAATLTRIRGLDPDHVALAATFGRREAPWQAIVPWTWVALRARLPGLESQGQDEVGERWRAALQLDGSAREAELDALQMDHPELRGLARLRAGGLRLDGPGASR